MPTENLLTDRDDSARQMRQRMSQASRDRVRPERALRGPAMIAGAILLGLAALVGLKLWIFFHMLMAHAS